MTEKLYTTRVSFQVVVESHNPFDANQIVSNLLHNLEHAPETDGVLTMDDVEWVIPDQLCQDCGAIGDLDVCSITPMICDTCCDHEHIGGVL